MKKLLAALAICLCPLAAHGQKTRYGQEPPHAKAGVDYPVPIHISGVHYRGEYKGQGKNENVIYADAVLDGNKIELMGDLDQVPFKAYDFLLGDFHARLLKDPNKPSVSPLFQEYEVILPNKIVWHCTVTGISE